MLLVKVTVIWVPESVRELLDATAPDTSTWTVKVPDWLNEQQPDEFVVPLATTVDPVRIWTVAPTTLAPHALTQIMVPTTTWQQLRRRWSTHEHSNGETMRCPDSSSCTKQRRPDVMPAPPVIVLFEGL